jgi:ABC-type uncharacterized transport system fused permease/ATPase subunit
MYNIRLSFSMFQKIKNYVLGDSREILLVHGEAGCGKTSVMALAAKQAWSWLDGDISIVIR